MIIKMNKKTKTIAIGILIILIFSLSVISIKKNKESVRTSSETLSNQKIGNIL